MSGKIAVMVVLGLITAFENTMRTHMVFSVKHLVK